MIKYLIAILILIPGISKSQNTKILEDLDWVYENFSEDSLSRHDQFVYKDSIKIIKQLISGIWEYKGRYLYGNLQIDTILGCGEVNYKNETFNSKVIITEHGFYDIFKDKKGELHKIPNNTIHYTECFDFRRGSNGYCEIGVDPTEDTTMIMTCQPVPEIVYFKGFIWIMWTGMAGQGLERIELIDRDQLKRKIDNSEYCQLWKRYSDLNNIEK